MLVGKNCFYQNAGNLGRWWTWCHLETTSEDSASPWKVLRGNTGSNLGGALRWGIRTAPHGVQACVRASWSLEILPEILSCSQFVLEIPEGEAREEIWSPVHYLCFISVTLLWPMERTHKLGKILCDEKIWKVCQGPRWVEHGVASFKISDKTKGPPEDSSFLPKATYTTCVPLMLLTASPDSSVSPSIRVTLLHPSSKLTRPFPNEAGCSTLRTCISCFDIYTLLHIK